MSCGPTRRATLALTLLLAGGCGGSDSPSPDTRPPDAVDDLRVMVLAPGALRLTWTATGDDGATGRAAAYDLRYAPDSLTEARWASAVPWPTVAPHASGEADSVDLAGLDANRPLFFALKVVDDASNSSALSNIVSAWARPGPDSLAPAAVTDLAAVAPRLARVTLRWKAPGDDGHVGRAARYEVRYGTGPLTEATWAAAAAAPGLPVPAPAGAAESLAVAGLEPGTRYVFALRTFDGAGHASGLSNTAVQSTLAPTAVEALVSIPAGVFEMGSPPEEPGRDPIEIPHPVTLTRGFYLSDHEVTQADFERTMGWNLSIFRHAGNPVESVTWFDALDYCNRVSTREGLRPAYRMTEVRRTVLHITQATVAWDDSANGFRLPTEAEWEFACRAGTTTAFHSGPITEIQCQPLDPNLDRVGCYCGNSVLSVGLDRREPIPVRQKGRNGYRLYDMHGNVEEWCWDWYGAYPAGPVTDPEGPVTGADRAVRGGSWDYYAQHCRSAARTSIPPGATASVLGFRMARSRP